MDWMGFMRISDISKLDAQSFSRGETATFVLLRPIAFIAWISGIGTFVLGFLIVLSGLTDENMNYSAATAALGVALLISIVCNLILTRGTLRIALQARIRQARTEGHCQPIGPPASAAAPCFLTLWERGSQAHDRENFAHTMYINVYSKPTPDGLAFAMLTASSDRSPFQMTGFCRLLLYSLDPT